MRCSLGLFALLAGLTTACGPTSSSSQASYPEPRATIPADERNAQLQPSADLPVPSATSEPVNLAQLLRYAAAHAPSLSIARQRSQLGNAYVEGAETLIPYNPEVSVSAGARASEGVSRFEFEAELEQRFEIAGERGTRIEAAERSREALRADLDVARWKLHATVHALFSELLVRQKQSEAASKLERFTESVRQVIEKRVAAGEDSPLDTIVAKAELARASQTVLAAKQAHRAASLRLSGVVGWPATTPLRVSGQLAPPAAVTDSAGLIKAALMNHPSARRLTLEVRAAEARIEREDREAWPDPALGVRYAREGEAGGAAHVWMGTLRVPLPVWERNQAGRARARAELGIVRTEQSMFSQTLGVRIEAAVARVNAAAERLQLYDRDLLPAFEGNLDKLKRAFELGEVDVLKLAQIQQRILIVQRDALEALADYYDSLAALEALSGVEVLSNGAAKP